MDIARDYVATLSPGDVSRLPEPCRPGKFFEADDVTTFALVLVRYDFIAHEASARVLHKLSAFFSNASIRLSEIMARRTDVQSDSRTAA